eukprot:Tbor_TRINITY_DN5294_c2_g6::TRINITY_DN5294_c2_g6_i1::g.16013::m.16013
MSYLASDFTNTPKREETLVSPVLCDGSMDEWDRKLHAESAVNRLSQQRGVGWGTLPTRQQHHQEYKDPLEGLSQALSSKAIARQVKYDVARVAMAKSGIPIPAPLSDELVDKIVCLLGNELFNMSLTNRIPSPGGMDGRSTIDTELMWSEIREVPDDAKIHASRPCVPGEDPAQIIVKQRMAKKAQSHPIKPLPTSHISPSVLFGLCNNTRAMELCPFDGAYNNNNGKNNNNNINRHNHSHQQHAIVGNRGLGKGSVARSASSVFSECGSTCSNGQSSAFSSGGSGGGVFPTRYVWK